MHVRQLASADVGSALELVAVRPHANLLLAASLEKQQLLGLVGIFDRDALVAVASTNANCATTDLTPETAAVLASFLAREGRRSASIVGRAPNVRLLWDALDGRWGTMRALRAQQLLMVLDAPSVIDADPMVRRAVPAELDIVFPACVHMFTEEVGTSPVANGMGGAYRDRVHDLITAGRSFVRIVDGVVQFKTEVGATSSSACQLQGVWVAPHLRGRGLAAPGVAAVADVALREIAPATALYVNDFNTAAIRTYERVGFRQVDTFSTVFF